MRAKVTALLTLLFIAGYNLYVLNSMYRLYSLSDEDKKIYMYAIFAIFVLPLMVMGNTVKYDDPDFALEIEFRKISQLIYSFCVGVIIINNMGFMQDPFSIIVMFNGLTFVFVSAILINAHRHGLFKNNG